MMDKGFGGSAAAFNAAEEFHGAVPVFHHALQVLAFVAIAGLVLALTCCADVHPVSWMEHLCLRAAHHLKIV